MKLKVTLNSDNKFYDNLVRSFSQKYVFTITQDLKEETAIITFDENVYSRYQSLKTEIIPNKLWYSASIDSLVFCYNRTADLTKYKEVHEFIKKSCPHIQDYIQDMKIKEIEINMHILYDTYATQYIQISTYMNYLKKDYFEYFHFIVLAAIVRDFYEGYSLNWDDDLDKKKSFNVNVTKILIKIAKKKMSFNNILTEYERSNHTFNKILSFRFVNQMILINIKIKPYINFQELRLLNFIQETYLSGAL